ncbi:unnamed protein product [Moneuplotes crassus]|uniref:Uncharacterized protein n=1 Tax=Euplotes crassus TaxID=5936 RepID=A0AAD1U9Y2_EUPCR|nr:unnamed protein product [Moneuplotes crassus]
MESTKSVSTAENFSRKTSKHSTCNSPTMVKNKENCNFSKTTKNLTFHMPAFECRNSHPLNIMRKVAEFKQTRKGTKGRNLQLSTSKTSELLNDLPIFNEPDIVQKSKELINESLWSNVADFILHAKKGEIKNYLDDRKSVTNLPFLFEKVDSHSKLKSYIRKSRRTGFNDDPTDVLSPDKGIYKSSNKVTKKAVTSLVRNEHSKNPFRIDTIKKSITKFKKSWKRQQFSSPRKKKLQSILINKRDEYVPPIQQFKNNLRSTLTFRSKNENMRNSSNKSKSCSKEEHSIQKNFNKKKKVFNKVGHVKSHKTLQKAVPRVNKRYGQKKLNVNLDKYKFNSPPPNSIKNINKKSIMSLNGKYLITSPPKSTVSITEKKPARGLSPRALVNKSEILKKIKDAVKNGSPFAKQLE